MKLQLFKMFSMTLLTGLLGGALGALCINHFYVSKTAPRIGTVNITSLVDQFVQMQASNNSSAQEKQIQIKAFGESLEAHLKEIAAKEKVVLLPSEAVIAGATNYTQELRQQLKEQAIH